MITHKQFIDKWNWNRYRESAALGHQCVALVKKYCEEVYWIKWITSGWSAINGWNRLWNFDTYFDRVDLPSQWDIVFFDKTPNNPYWHIAIHNDDFSIIEQNWGVWGGTGLWVDAIRVHKAPSNAVGFMRPKPIDVKPLQQMGNPDCSLLSTINCYRLNQWSDSRSFTQEIVNWYMVEYMNKNPMDAYRYLKDKWYNIKIIHLTFEKALIRLKRWSAVCIFLKWGKNHWTCIKQIDSKYYIFDSNLPDKKEFDIIKIHNEWKITWECFQVK